MIRRGIKDMLEEAIGATICGESGNAQEALDLVQHLKPDLAIVDLTLEGKSGLDFIREVRRLIPDLQTLAYSMHEEKYYAERVLTSGGRGYLMKSEAPANLIEAVETVLKGGVYLSKTMSAQMLQRMSGRPVEAHRSLIHMLTDRELEVFDLIGRAKESREIAKLLNMSLKTVETHRSHIRQKLEIRSRSELIQQAVRWVEGRSS